MTEKQGSKGGNARKSNLTPEQRKAIASSGAKARWEKFRQKKEEEKQAAAVPDAKQEVAVIEAQPPVPTPAEIGRSRAKQKPVLKVYGQALAAAEKEYSEAITELAYHDEMSARLKARIPMLAQTIRTLGGVVTGTPISPEPQAAPYIPPSQRPSANPDVMTSTALPPVPQASGGAMGVIEEAAPDDIFLRESQGEFV